MSYTRKEADNMRALERRATFLESLSATAEDNSYDKREARALRWALAEIEAARGPLPEWKEPGVEIETA